MKGAILTQGQPFRINPEASERSSMKIPRKFNAARDGKMTTKDVARAIKQYKIDSDKPNPIGV